MRRYKLRYLLIHLTRNSYITVQTCCKPSQTKQKSTATSICRHKKTYPGTKHEVDQMTRCGDIADFSLRMHISTTFLLLAEVLVMDSESHTPFFIFSSELVIMAPSGLVFKIWAWDRQTTDERLQCLGVPPVITGGSPNNLPPCLDRAGH